MNTPSMATSLSYSYTPPHISTLSHTFPSSHTNNSLTFPTCLSSTSLNLRFTLQTRGMSRSKATRAGPSSNQFIFAFVFPLSLLAVTAFTAFRIGIRLDQKFLEELAMNEALREEEEVDDELAQVVTSRKEEPALPQSRKRPRREI